jgi:hypothetical protein
MSYGLISPDHECGNTQLYTAVPKSPLLKQAMTLMIGACETQRSGK